MNHIFNDLSNFLANLGTSPEWAPIITCILLSITAVAASWLLYFLLNSIANPLIEKITKRTSTKVDDILLRDNFLCWCWWLMAALCLRWLLPMAMVPYRSLTNWCDMVMDIAIIGFATKVATEFVRGFFLVVFDHEHVAEEAQKMHQAEEEEEEYHYVPSHSLQGLQQMINIVIVAIGIILMISTMLGKNPLMIVSGLGACAAVIMLVFKDSILGVVAGIQLAVNDMLRPGDWIVAPKSGADGRVLEVTLATVKVRNWDHSIVTIPPYSLISSSFQSWRGMEESGGRRVARSIFIDMNSVRFLTDEEKEAFAAEPWAADTDLNAPCVNLSLFRRYAEHLVLTQPTLKKSMHYMVRELDPTPQGIPVEIYFFTSKTSWTAFEKVQAAVIDCLIANVPRFGLRVFQAPSGDSIREAAREVLTQPNILQNP